MSLESPEFRTREDRLRLALLESLVSVASRRKEIRLRDIGRIVRDHLWLFIAVTAAVSLASVALALYLPNEYTATAILEPAPEKNVTGLEGLASQFGGLASLANLAGFNIPVSTQQDRPDEAIALLEDQGFLDAFIRKYHLQIPISAATGWDPKTNRLIIDSRLYDVKERKWVGKFKTPYGVSAEPTGYDLYIALKRRISVSENKNNGLVTLGIRYYSPIMARQWVEELVSELNSKFELQDRVQAQKSIEYLNDQLSHTGIAEVRAFLFALLEQQTQKLMLTKVSNGYVFQTLVAADVPDKKSGPERVLIVALGAVLGAGVATLVAAMVNERRKRRVPLDAR